MSAGEEEAGVGEGIRVGMLAGWGACRVGETGKGRAVAVDGLCLNSCPSSQAEG